MNPLLSLRRATESLSLIITALSTYAGENEWPQFRGPTGQGLSNATNVPIEWSSTTNIAWKTELPGTGWSSPVISRGRVYFTAAIRDPDTAETTLHALCVDAVDGRVLWNVEVFRPDPSRIAAMHRKNSPASATPIVIGERLYVHFGHMGTAALDLSGKVLWRQDELRYSPVHGNGGSPILSGDALIFSADGGQDPFVVALDTMSGSIRWKTPRNSRAKKQFSFSTPLAIEVAGKTQIISPTSGFVGAYDPADGHELWRVSYDEGYSVVPRPVFAHGLLFVSSGFDQPVLYAISPDGAVGDVTDTHVAWTHRKGAPLTTSPLALADDLYFISDNGIATCVDARTGTVHWSERLGGDFSASPVAADGRVYCQNEAGVSFVLKEGKAFELLAKNDLGERTFASYGVTDGALFIRSEKHLWKVGPLKETVSKRAARSGE